MKTLILTYSLLVPVIIYSQELYPINNGEKWGFCDSNLEVVIPYKYDLVGFFHDKVATIRINDKMGFINRSGEIIIEPKFQWTSPFVNGYAFVISEGDKKYSIINQDGQVLANKAFSVDASVNNGLIRDKGDNGLWGFKILTGEFAIKPKYTWVDDYSEGLALISIDSFYYNYIDTIGELISTENFEFEETKFSLNDKPFFIDNRFSEGLAAIKQNGKYGYINKKGQIVIKPEYDYATPFHEGKAAVKIDSAWGFIDVNNNMIIKPQFKQTGFFNQNKCMVSKQHGLYDIKWMLIDENGNALSYEFDHCPVTIGKPVELRNLIPTYFFRQEVWGYLNHKGELVFKSDKLHWSKNYPMYETKYY